MTHRYRLPAVMLAATAILLLAACSSSEAEIAPPAATVDDLPDMLLADESVVVGGFTMNVDPSTRHGVSFDEIMATSFNPTDDADDMERYGWEADYGEWFVRPDDQTPVYFISTGVSWYSSAEGASNDVVDEFEDAQRAAGQTNAQGVQLIAVQAFVVDLDGARGTIFTTQQPSGPVTVTIVRVARGQTVAGVGIAAADNRDLRADATALAARLADQVSTVLNAGVSPTPSPTPAPPATPTATPRP